MRFAQKVYVKSLDTSWARSRNPRRRKRSPPETVTRRKRRTKAPAPNPTRRKVRRRAHQRAARLCKVHQALFLLVEHSRLRKFSFLPCLGARGPKCPQDIWGRRCFLATSPGLWEVKIPQFEHWSAFGHSKILRLPNGKRAQCRRYDC